MKKNLDSDTASTLESIYNWDKPRLVVVGLYSSQKLEISDIINGFLNGTLWNSDIGIMAMVDSSLPGLIVSPVANRLLDSKGYTKVIVGNLTAYQTSVNPGERRRPANFDQCR